MVRVWFKNATKRTRGGDPFWEDYDEPLLQPILGYVTQGTVLSHALSPGSSPLPA